MLPKAEVEQVAVGREGIDGRVRPGICFDCRSQSVPDKGELAPVRLIPRSGRERIPVRLQLTLIASDRRRQVLADLRQARRLTEVASELANPLAVPGHQGPAL